MPSDKTPKLFRHYGAPEALNHSQHREMVWTFAMSAAIGRLGDTDKAAKLADKAVAEYDARVEYDQDDDGRPVPTHGSGP